MPLSLGAPGKLLVQWPAWAEAASVKMMGDVVGGPFLGSCLHVPCDHWCGSRWDWQCRSWPQGFSGAMRGASSVGLG